MLTYVLVFFAGLFLWAWWETMKMRSSERAKRQELEDALKSLPHIDISPTKISIVEHGMVAYALAVRLKEANAYIVKASQAMELAEKIKTEHEQYLAKTATCLANFGDIPDKWNDGSMLHRAIREAIAKAKAA